MRGLKPRLVVSNEAVRKPPAPPTGLSKEAQAEWRRVVPDLIARKVITETDFGCLEGYCIAYGRVRVIERTLNRQGMMVGGKQHPLIRQQTSYLDISRRYAAELGLTPVSRQRTGGKPAEEGEDDFA